eukprot:478027_1
MATADGVSIKRDSSSETSISCESSEICSKDGDRSDAPETIRKLSQTIAGLQKQNLNFDESKTRIASLQEELRKTQSNLSAAQDLSATLTSQLGSLSSRLTEVEGDRDLMRDLLAKKDDEISSKEQQIDQFWSKQIDEHQNDFESQFAQWNDHCEKLSAELEDNTDR